MRTVTNKNGESTEILVAEQDVLKKIVRWLHASECVALMAGIRIRSCGRVDD